MCGICGFSGPPDSERLAAMLRLLEHRGPDAEGVHETAIASVGARRLAIIDVHGGRQPALNEDGTIAAVLNGEIYNHRELRLLLQRRGHELTAESDTAVLPHLYEEFGPAFTTMLEGMFAVAICDERNERLVLARDRAGEKPLLWSRTSQGVVFASELQALTRGAALRQEIDPLSLRLYLALQYVPGPRTIFSGVEKLAAGHRLVAERGTVSIERWWELPHPDSAYFESFAGAAEELRDLLGRAVEAQRQADVPVGALLSGGIDSAGIVALLARGRSGAVRTFTVGFQDRRLDERPAARAIARVLGTRHTEVESSLPSVDELRMIIRR
ncbi:MAG TPA: asparagine synthase (glutamine-hydrolyzing), partial [Solirubrobacteraceae bacterium]|nr:asparagine synthase (glutamine-hydrolyzing) [Solirubrobacteraceae bacterium]